jgi:hypothetical protein
MLMFSVHFSAEVKGLLTKPAECELLLSIFARTLQIKMKAASVNEIKQELDTLKPTDVKDLCLRLARYKKENKELLTYLLFEAHDEKGYIESVKNEIDEAFEELPKSNLHLTKKSLRRVLRSLTKYGRHTGSTQSQVEMLLHFCSKLKHSGIPIHKSVALENLYFQQIKKINKLLESIHEDLRYDYTKQLSTFTDMETPGNRFLSWFKKK